jgi:hypothetical protein
MTNQIAACGKMNITTLVAALTCAKVSERVSTAAATTGNLLRHDPAAGQYIFNWSTKDLSAGTHRLFINLGDGVTRTVNLGLK